MQIVGTMNELKLPAVLQTLLKSCKMQNAKCKMLIAFSFIVVYRMDGLSVGRGRVTKDQIYVAIKSAIECAPRNGYVAELHIQSIKYANELEYVSGREFCDGVGLKPAWGTEFIKMKKIAGRLAAAGLIKGKL